MFCVTAAMGASVCSNMIRALAASVVGPVKWTAQPVVGCGLVGVFISLINDRSGACLSAARGGRLHRSGC